MAFAWSIIQGGFDFDFGFVFSPCLFLRITRNGGYKRKFCWNRRTLLKRVRYCGRLFVFVCCHVPHTSVLLNLFYGACTRVRTWMRRLPFFFFLGVCVCGLFVADNFRVRVSRFRSKLATKKRRRKKKLPCLCFMCVFALIDTCFLWCCFYAS